MTARGPALAGLVALALTCGGDPMEAPPAEEEDVLPPGAVVDELASFDPALWQVMDHALGRGKVAAGNASHGDGKVELRLPAGTFDGGELRSVRRLTHGVVEGRLRAAAAPGAITALFLYQGRATRNDEVDIELLGGTRTVLFTVWQEDVEVFNRSVTLDFDPSQGFHDYRISWFPDRVEWRVDGTLAMTATGITLGTGLYLYVNAWWPTWLQGGPAATDDRAVVERLVT
ncbi:MAG: family 16 glycosylhydrolase [Longimicrobiales bacterium]